VKFIQRWSFCKRFNKINKYTDKKSTFITGWFIFTLVIKWATIKACPYHRKWACRGNPTREPLSQIMFNAFKLFLWLTPLFSLVACSDNIPTTISPNPSIEATDTMSKLRLDVPSLKGWKKIPQIRMTIGDTIELLVTLENPDGLGLPNQILFISSQKGNFFTENNLLTDHNGQVTSLLLATVLGKDRIIVTNQAGLSVTLPILTKK